ncbi:dual specificity protein phosphatase MPK-4-like [Zophobas morio]|uniref:dual specificity protein phosphatase MPK-4-like n=1 Tax=Zophobas morio TaxID=2755281 RepID=UPI003083B1A5
MVTLPKRISIDLIEPNLYLGNRSAAKDRETIKKYNITHILTIDQTPLPHEIVKNENLTTTFICLGDQPEDDLLYHLDDTYAFISKGLSKGCVLVHCFYGVCRSASTIIAFIMRKHHVLYKEAFERVQEQRNKVCPNTGLIAQLKLYQEMGYKVDSSYKNYRIYRLQKVANQVREMQLVPQECKDIIQKDPGLGPVAPRANVYCCKECSRVLADESQLIPHKTHQAEVCNMAYFVFPIDWMDCCKILQRALWCPQCNVNVGSFNWNIGIRCPECHNAHIPAFCLTPARVEFIKGCKP